VAEEDVTSWDRVCNSDNVTVYKKMAHDSPLILLKTYALIEGITMA